MNDRLRAALFEEFSRSQATMASARDKFPNLSHAILDGAAIHDNTCVREFVKSTIANGADFQHHRWSIPCPCGFYFGDDVENAVERFDALAAPVFDLLCDQESPLHGLPRWPQWLLDYGKGGILLWWIYWLADQTGEPVLRPVRGTATLRDGRLPAISALTPLSSYSIFFPNGTSAFANTPLILSEKPGEYTDDQDEFSCAWQAIRDGEITEITIYQRNVFQCASVGIGAIMDFLSTDPKNKHKTDRQAGGNQQTATPTRPTDDAIAAYRAEVLTGQNQTQLAALLTTKLNRAVSQGQVSRWLTEVKNWLDAGNILPELTMSRAAISVDPEKLDMGERRDHRTRRQRGHEE